MVARASSSGRESIKGAALGFGGGGGLPVVEGAGGTAQSFSAAFSASPRARWHVALDVELEVVDEAEGPQPPSIPDTPPDRSRSARSAGALGSWIVDLGARIQDPASRIQDRPESWIPDHGFRTLDPGSWIHNPGSRILNQFSSC